MSHNEQGLKDLQTRLGYQFGRPELLTQSLCHKSSSLSDGIHNEKLEFLGDAVLDLVLAELLMREFPDDEEGGLSKKRAGLVNERTLSQVACELGLGELLRLGKSEIVSAGDKKPRILASSFEALLGAIYTDGGFAPVKAIVESIFLNLIRNGDAEQHFARDYKTQFQELIQSREKITPIYQVISQTGPSHAREFTVSVEVSGKAYAQAKGPSKKIAEQEAARLALEAAMQGPVVTQTFVTSQKETL